MSITHGKWDGKGAAGAAAERPRGPNYSRKGWQTRECLPAFYLISTYGEAAFMM